MNIICKYFCTGSPLALMLSGVLLFGNASAHTYTTLNEYQIDRANETASTSVLQLQVFLSDMFKQKYMADRWPDLKLSAMRPPGCLAKIPTIKNSAPVVIPLLIMVKIAPLIPSVV